MKKCFIGMSINKQLYFGILGTSFLFCFLCILLILLSSLKLFFHFNDNIKYVYNELDTNIVSLNAEIADIYAQLLFHQGNFETYFYRNYYNNLNEEIGRNLLSTINIDDDEINLKFHFYNISGSENCTNDEKCYFVFGSQLNNETKKKLYILIPTIEISLDTYSFNKEDLKIFNKFNFYEKESGAYISYEYHNNSEIDINFNDNIQPSTLMNNTIQYINSSISSIEKLNNIIIENLTYKEFFDDNIITLFAPKGSQLIFDPYNNYGQQTFHFASILFNNTAHNIKIDLNDLCFKNIDNYISFDIKFNYLSYLTLNFIKNNGNFVFLFDKKLSFSASRSICRLNDYTNFSYSDNSIKESFDLTEYYLQINESQFESIDDCLISSEIQEIINDTENNYKLKVLYDIYKYSDGNDINNHIRMKILRESSPNNYTTSFLNLKFYYSISYYFVVFKIYNNIMILLNMLERLIYRQVAYILLFLFILWVCVFIYVTIKLCLVADRISSPIRKLIKTISLSKANINTEEMKFEQIYYPEDKDINDLFQLCQKLIFGGVKNKINIRKKNKLNVYNNISKVKTNNMAINENLIMIQRNQKYNEIFEKGEDKENIVNDSFKKDLFFKYKNKEFDNKIKNYESKKLKKLPFDKKEEYENIKNKNSEYKMFYYINKEVEEFMPYNNLYKYYIDKFAKKSTKKKKK